MKNTKIFLQILSLFVVFGVILALLSNKSESTVITDEVNSVKNFITKNSINDQMNNLPKIPEDSLTDILKTKPDTVIMETSMGDMTIALYETDAPLHVANFKKLVYTNYYDDILFHRVIKNFMIQGGDPNSRDGDESTWGQGGPGYTIPAEIKLRHEVGSLAAARLDNQVNPNKESSGSQFYIVTGEASYLDGQYTVYGRVIEGIEVAKKIQDVKTTGSPYDRPIKKVVIKKIYFAE